MSSQIRFASWFGFVALVGALSGCSDPECPDGYYKSGKSCLRVDSGTADGSVDDDDSGPSLEDSGSPVTVGDAGGSSDTGTDAAAVANDAGAGASNGALDAGTDAIADAEPAADTGTLCDGGSCVGPCTGSNGAAVCVGATLHLCNADGTTQSASTCASARQCELGIAPKRCAPCSPGTYRCTDVHLEVCDTDGSTWKAVKDCATAALCNTTAGDCTAAACTASTRVCEGDNLRGCNATQTGLMTLQQCDPGMCDQAGKQCDVCVANAKTCNGDTRVVCDATGQNTTRTPCTAPKPRCVGAASCVQCTEASECSTPANTCQAAVCNASGDCGATSKPARTPCAGGVCNGGTSCVECIDATECAGKTGKPFCSGNRCVQCSAANPCTGPHQICQNDLCVTQPYCGDNIWTQNTESCDPTAPSWSRWTCTPSCQKTNLYGFARCNVDSDCGEGQQCAADGYCARTCVGGVSQCPATQAGTNTTPYCPQNYPLCFAAGCNANADCAPGLVCKSLQGTKVCTFCSTPGTQSDCTAGKSCVALGATGVAGHCLPL